MDANIKTCSNCTHYHGYPDKLMCDAGRCEVIIIGHVVVTMDNPGCDIHNPIPEEPKRLGRPPKNV